MYIIDCMYIFVVLYSIFGTVIIEHLFSFAKFLILDKLEFLYITLIVSLV